MCRAIDKDPSTAERKGKWNTLVGGLGALGRVGQAALSAGLAVRVPGHEDAGTARRLGALAPEALDLAVRVDLVVLENGHLDLLALVLDLLGRRVLLLFALLGTTPQAEDEVEGRLLLDVVVRKGATVLELLAGKDETLLIGGNALFVLNLGLTL